MNKILTGEEAEKACDELLKNKSLWVGNPVTGYFESTNIHTNKKVFVAFDNTTGDMWVEDFNTSLEAESWCKGEIETEGL